MEDQVRTGMMIVRSQGSISLADSGITGQQFKPDSSEHFQAKWRWHLLHEYKTETNYRGHLEEPRLFMISIMISSQMTTRSLLRG